MLLRSVVARKSSPRSRATSAQPAGVSAEPLDQASERPAGRPAESPPPRGRAPSHHRGAEEARGAGEQPDDGLDEPADDGHVVAGQRLPDVAGEAEHQQRLTREERGQPRQAQAAPTTPARSHATTVSAVSLQPRGTDSVPSTPVDSGGTSRPASAVTTLRLMVRARPSRAAVERSSENAPPSTAPTAAVTSSSEPALPAGGPARQVSTPALAAAAPAAPLAAVARARRQDRRCATHTARTTDVAVDQRVVTRLSGHLSSMPQQ